MSSTVCQVINSNYRFNPVFERINGFKKILKSDDAARIFNAALPLLTLVCPLQLAVTLQSGCTNSYANICNISTHYQRGAINQVLIHLSELALTVIATGLSVFRPRVAVFAGEGVKVIQNIYDLSLSVYNLEGKEAVLKLLSISHSAIFIASLTIATPELIAISIIAQGTLELYQAYQEYKADHKIEAGFKLLQGSIRLIQAKPYIEKSYENARFTLENHRRQQLIKKTLYNNPKDWHFVVQPKDFVKTQHHKYILPNQVVTANPVIEVQSNEGKERCFHYVNPAGTSHWSYYKVNPEGPSYYDTSKKIPELYLKVIQDQTNIFFHTGTTCYHEDFGKGTWEMRYLGNKYDWTISVAINFDKDSKISPTQIMDKVLVEKTKTPVGTSMTPLKWVLERFF